MRAPSVKDEKLAQLRAAYEMAWRRFSAVVREWQASETEQPGGGEGDWAAAVEAAEQEYREARNELADYTLAQLQPTRGASVLSIRLQQDDGVGMAAPLRTSDVKVKAQRVCSCC